MSSGGLGEFEGIAAIQPQYTTQSESRLGRVARDSLVRILASGGTEARNFQQLERSFR